MARRRAQTPARTQELTRKAAVVRAMLKDLARVPNVWKEHRVFSRTPKGLAIHALNLDGDVGPWLQVLKLKGLREEAAKAGMFSLNGAEIELMNLSGPATGRSPGACRPPTSSIAAATSAIPSYGGGRPQPS